LALVRDAVRGEPVSTGYYRLLPELSVELYRRNHPGVQNLQLFCRPEGLANRLPKLAGLAITGS
jgi:hypothetical protein